MYGETPFDRFIDLMDNVVDELNVFGQDLLETEDVQALVIEMNRDNMYAGKRSDGSDILKADGEGYRPYTIKKKKEQGAPYDRVTLHDKGDFYASERIRYLSGAMQLEATDWKTEQLQATWGEDILGINNQNIEDLQALLLPEFQSFGSNYFSNIND